MTQPGERHEIELPSGTIRYREAGQGSPVVFVHGFLVDGRLWDGVVERLAERCRCIVPDWPFGAQRVAMKPDADLTPYGIAELIDGFLGALDLRDATLVGNDFGGAMSQVTAARRPERIGRLVLTNCDTHENFPPGIFRYVLPLATLPGAVAAMAAPLRIGAVARAAYRPFSKRPAPPELIDSWTEPARTDAAVRRDMKKLMSAMHSRYTLEAAAKLHRSELPLLLAWAPGDRYFPLQYAERLAAEVPNARIVEIPDARTFVPLDQPQRVADEIAAFAPTAA